MIGLGPADRQILADASAALNAGHADRALALALPLADRLSGNADVQMLCGMAFERSGDAKRAEEYFERAVTAAPDNAAIRNIHANSVSLAGDPQRALLLFDALIADCPDLVDAHINRALVAEQAGDRDRAIRYCDEAVHRFPADPRIAATRGAMLKNEGRLDEAIADLEKSVAADPSRPRTHHNLGVALTAVGEAEQGVRHLSRAVELGMTDTHSIGNWAAALLEAGEVASARSLYEKILAHEPSNAEAARALTRLLREYGQGDDAFAHYRRWTSAQADNPAAWEALIGALVRFGEFRQVIEVANEALARHPELLSARVEKAFASGMTGQPGPAAAELEQLAGRLDAPSLTPRIMQLRVMAGDAEKAAALGLRFTAQYPTDQSGWAWLATAWAVLGDPREHWLCDYDRLVQPVDVAPEGMQPQDYATEIARTLDALHATKHAPGDQSLRSGTQTSGALFDRRDPEIRAFRDAVLQSARRIIDSFPDDPSHPFLSRKSGRIGFSGSWSVRLSTSGRHVPHFHGQGWMSSAFYARLPEDVSAQGREGWIMFGKPPEELGIDIEPRRFVKPEPGLMVLFPSYMWHGTVPFARGVDRLTAAFDFIPL